MTQNVGTADRAFRLVAGIGILTAGALYESWWGAIGILFLATGLTRWCPAYLPFGMSTCSRKPESQE